mgnify:CR=1 FL=1
MRCLGEELTRPYLDRTAHQDRMRDVLPLWIQETVANVVNYQSTSGYHTSWTYIRLQGIQQMHKVVRPSV